MHPVAHAALSACVAAKLAFLCSGGSLRELALSSPLVAPLNDHVLLRAVEGGTAATVPVGARQRYGPRGRQHLEIHRPRGGGAAPRTAFVYFHGGAFLLGGHALGRAAAAWAAAHGMLGVTVGYALANDARWNGTETAVQDALDAVAHVRRAHPELGALVLAGESAGAAVALAAAHALAARGAPVAATVCSWPLTTLDARFYAPSWEGGAWRETSPASVAAAPTLFAPRGAEGVGGPQAQIARALTDLGVFGRARRGWLSARARYRPRADFVAADPLPPTLLLCAERDRVTPLGQQRMFADTLRRSRVRVAIFEGADHGEGGFHSEEGRALVLRFLRRHAAAAGVAARETAAGRALMEGHLAALRLPSLRFAPRRGGRPPHAAAATARLARRP